MSRFLTCAISGRELVRYCQPSQTSDRWSPSAPTPPLIDSSALPHSALAASKAVVSRRASLAVGPCNHSSMPSTKG